MRVLKKLLANKSLIIYLAKNDFKNKFAGSFFGVVWGFVQPIVTLLLYWFVFQVGLRSGGVRDVPFILWLMAGLIPWFYFQEALTNATNCFIEYSYLVKKVVFNIDVLPIVKIISSIFVHVFFVLVMVLLYILYGYYPGIEILQLVYYSLCMVALVASLAYLTSAISIFFKDMSQIISIIMQIGTWMTPILWDITAVPEIFRWIFKINPMYYVVEGYRDTLIQGGLFFDNIGGTIYFWSFVVIACVISKKIYTSLKPHFSDVL
ncbi:ABC transporter permease [Erysipelotrichaceae bacterium HCN-30851]